MDPGENSQDFSTLQVHCNFGDSFWILFWWYLHMFGRLAYGMRIDIEGILLLLICFWIGLFSLRAWSFTLKTLGWKSNHPKISANTHVSETQTPCFSKSSNLCWHVTYATHWEDRKEVSNANLWKWLGLWTYVISLCIVYRYNKYMYILHMGIYVCAVPVLYTLRIFGDCNEVLPFEPA